MWTNIAGIEPMLSAYMHNCDKSRRVKIKAINQTLVGLPPLSLQYKRCYINCPLQCTLSHNIWMQQWHFNFIEQVK